MDLNPQDALRTVQSYLRTTEPLRRLGWGIGGIVYLSPDGRTAVMMHRRDEGFDRELEVYRRLRRLRITTVQGLTVPKLRGYRSAQRLIQMDFVVPPYLLDFAGVSFEPPDFPPETMEQWETGVVEMYGSNAWIAHAVYATLAKHGLYYMDFRPSNMKLDGLPGLEPHEPDE